MENIIKLSCKEGMVDRINQTLKRLNDKGFNAVFNGNNFDLVDDKGRCQNSEWGIDFDLLEEYSLLTHYFTVGERVIITYERTKELDLWFDEDEKEDADNIKGKIGTIEEISSGGAYGIGDSILFEIEIDGDRGITTFIAGDFKPVTE